MPRLPAPPQRGVYLRVSVTDRCDLRCRYCVPERGCAGGAPLGDDALVAVVEGIAEAVGARKIRFTGGEPLLRPGLTALIRALGARLPAAELALTTNGTRLARHARALRAAGIRALNVSLDTPDPARFAALTGRAALDDVLAGLRAARAAGFERLKLNAVLLRSRNQGLLAELVRVGVEHGVHEVRFIELMPIGPGARIHAEEWFSAEQALAELKRALHHLDHLGQEGTADRHLFRLDGEAIAVGLIAPVSCSFCAGCDRLRLDARGRLHACLRESAGAELVAGLPAGALRERVRGVLAAKRKPVAAWPARAMVAIGG